MIGERPAISSSGTRSRAALASRLIVFAVPTLTCTMMRLRRPGHQVGAVCHGDREVLVRHQHGARHTGACHFGAREALHDRRKIGAGVGEEVLDRMPVQRGEQDVGRRWRRLRRGLNLLPCGSWSSVELDVG